ncbi:MAG: FecR domain-containing protein [Vicinamibacterales bacterium]|nr:FecR domain-containing protein [Vicinamibacterales bacterium]
MRRLTRLVLTAVIALGFVAARPAAARAQDESSVDLPPPMRVVHVEGDISLIRDAASVEVGQNAPLIEGDRLRTANGRAELGLPRGAVIFLDRHSTIDLRTVNRVRLIEGRLRLASPGSAEPPDIVIDAPGATLTPSSVTSFLLETSVGPRGDEVVLHVDEGVVEFAGDRETLLVRAGESAAVRPGGAPAPATGYTRAERSEFDIWVGERLRRDEPRATPAAERSYLPDELGSYSATLGQYGTWDYEPDYGNVWYPSVSVDWRPYSVGYWDRVGAYGYYWIGGDPWAWPTHHYGRWGYRAGRWFWVPRRVWAPAWVSWSVGPGYVGWCPLGYDNLPVFGFGLGYSSWGGAYYYRGRPYYDRYDYWRGWSVLPSDRFHGRRFHSRDYVDARRLSREVTSAFVTQRVPPSYRRGGPNYAVPRYGTPRGSGAGSEAYDRARPYMDPRNGARGGSSSRASEAYDRARPYMDRRRVPDGAGEGGNGSSWGNGAYERARPYMNPNATPGVARPRSGESVSPGSRRTEPRGEGTPPQGTWGQPSQPQPRSEAPMAQPRTGSGSSWGTRPPRAETPRSDSSRSRTYSAPRGEPRSVERPSSRDDTAPRGYSAPRGSSSPRSHAAPRSSSAPRSSPGRSSWGGSSSFRSAPGASAPRGGGSSGRAPSAPRGSGGGRSRSPRG